MRTRRLALAGIGLIAALAVGVSGCGSDSSNGGGSDKGDAAAVQTEKPIDALNAAAAKLNNETFKIEMVMGKELSANGVMDPAGKKASMTMEMSLGSTSLNVDVIMIDSDIYLKMSGMPGMPEQWMHIDGSKAKGGSPLGNVDLNDPSGLKDLANALNDIERDGDRGFKGTIDLTKAPDFDDETRDALGDKANAIPFTAKVDDQGRLVEFVIDLAAVEPSLWQLKAAYFDFGTDAKIEAPPASETIEAPSELVESFTN